MFVIFDGVKPKKITYRYKFSVAPYHYFMGSDWIIYKCHEDSHGREGDMIVADDDIAVRDFYSNTGGKNLYA